MPMVWNIVRVVFVVLCVFLLIAVLLSLIGYPLMQFHPTRGYLRA